MWVIARQSFRFIGGALFVPASPSPTSIPDDVANDPYFKAACSDKRGLIQVIEIPKPPVPSGEPVIKSPMPEDTAKEAPKSAKTKA